MKIIHHRLEDGDKDPFEMLFVKGQSLIHYVEDSMDFGEFRPVNDYDKELHPLKIFLLAHGDDSSASGGEVYISNSPFMVIKTIEMWVNEGLRNLDLSIIHLQEFTSFESAYSVALAMREGHPLCYNE